MTKELEVPEELKELMLDWKVSIECRDKCIAMVFKAKRAIYYGKLADKANRKFWKKAKDLYPEINEGSWSYNFDSEKIIAVDQST